LDKTIGIKKAQPPQFRKTIPLQMTNETSKTGKLYFIWVIALLQLVSLHFLKVFRRRVLKVVKH